jgi:hypothetical protein
MIGRPRRAADQENLQGQMQVDNEGAAARKELVPELSMPAADGKPVRAEEEEEECGDVQSSSASEEEEEEEDDDEDAAIHRALMAAREKKAAAEKLAASKSAAKEDHATSNAAKKADESSDEEESEAEEGEDEESEDEDAVIHKALVAAREKAAAAAAAAAGAASTAASSPSVGAGAGGEGGAAARHESPPSSAEAFQSSKRAPSGNAFAKLMSRKPAVTAERSELPAAVTAAAGGGEGGSGAASREEGADAAAAASKRKKPKAGGGGAAAKVGSRAVTDKGHVCHTGKKSFAAKQEAEKAVDSPQGDGAATHSKAIDGRGDGQGEEGTAPAPAAAEGSSAGAAPAAVAAPPPPPLGVHEGFTCDRSGVCPIVGVRYTLVGDDYDLCQAEYDKLDDKEKAKYEAVEPPVQTAPGCFARSLLLMRGDEAIALEARNSTANKLAEVGGRVIGAANVCGTGDSFGRHAHVDYFGGARSIGRIEEVRRRSKKQRRFQHALTKLVQLDDDEIETLAPMADLYAQCACV